MSGVRDGQPVSVANALGMLDRALSCLVAVDAAGLPTAAQAEALLALERAEARHTAARALPCPSSSCPPWAANAARSRARAAVCRASALSKARSASA